MIDGARRAGGGPSRARRDRPPRHGACSSRCPSAGSRRLRAPCWSVCADSGSADGGLTGRTGGFALDRLTTTCWTSRIVVEEFDHLVVLDPPTSAVPLRHWFARAQGFTYLAWGEAEIRFSEQMHELEYGLRASLVALYRSLRERGGPPARSSSACSVATDPHGAPSQIGRPSAPGLHGAGTRQPRPGAAIPDRSTAAQPTELERSEAFQVYHQIYEEGQRFLRTAPHRL